MRAVGTEAEKQRNLEKTAFKSGKLLRFLYEEAGFLQSVMLRRLSGITFSFSFGGITVLRLLYHSGRQDFSKTSAFAPLWYNHEISV